MNLFIVSWLLTIASLVGAVFNARKSIVGFYIWIPTNIAWVIYSLIICQYALCLLFVTYTGVTIYGVVKWRKAEKGGEDARVP